MGVFGGTEPTRAPLPRAINAANIRPSASNAYYFTHHMEQKLMLSYTKRLQLLGDKPPVGVLDQIP